MPVHAAKLVASSGNPTHGVESIKVISMKPQVNMAHFSFQRTHPKLEFCQKSQDPAK